MTMEHNMTRKNRRLTTRVIRRNVRLVVVEVPASRTDAPLWAQALGWAAVGICLAALVAA
jgi:hypothetical protein